MFVATYLIKDPKLDLISQILLVENVIIDSNSKFLGVQIPSLLISIELRSRITFLKINFFRFKARFTVPKKTSKTISNEIIFLSNHRKKIRLIMDKSTNISKLQLFFSSQGKT